MKSYSDSSKLATSTYRPLRYAVVVVVVFVTAGTVQGMSVAEWCSPAGVSFRPCFVPAVYS